MTLGPRQGQQNVLRTAEKTLLGPRGVLMSSRPFDERLNVWRTWIETNIYPLDVCTTWFRTKVLSRGGIRGHLVMVLYNSVRFLSLEFHSKPKAAKWVFILATKTAPSTLVLTLQSWYFIYWFFTALVIINGNSKLGALFFISLVFSNFKNLSL